MDRGYVKLWRKSIDSRVFKSDGLWRFWSWCLMKASHKERWVEMKTGRGTTQVHILPGQFIFGRKTAGKELKKPPSTIRNYLKKLKTSRNLDTQEDTHYTIISIRNWDIYQADKNKQDTKEDNQRTTKGQPKDTNKNVKKDKNIKEPDKSGHYSKTFKEYAVEINESCKTILHLYFKNNVKWNPYSLVQWAANQKNHPAGVAAVLAGMIKLSGNIGKPAPYFKSALQIESGKWRAKDAEKEHEQMKSEWIDLVNKLRKVT